MTRKRTAAVMQLHQASDGLDVIYREGTRPPRAGDPGVELARAVVEYFGEGTIDEILTGDIALRNMALAIVAVAEARS